MMDRPKTCGATIELDNGESVTPCHKAVGHDGDHEGYCLGSRAVWSSHANTTPSELHGPAACPRLCSGCDGGHHWIEEAIDWEGLTGDELSEVSVPEGDERRSLPCWFECKHCDAWATCEYVWALEERGE